MDKQVPLRRVIIEMGMGSDLHGQDYTKAAARAIEDALRHVSLPILGTAGIDKDQMQVVVTLGVQKPEALDLAALAALLPQSAAQMRVHKGGLNVPVGEETIVVAQASIEVFLPPQTGWLLRGRA